MEKIRKHIEGLFSKAPKTRKAQELKEELIADLTEKYSDLIKDGQSDNQAYESVISGIGDIDELLTKITRDPLNYEINEANNKKTALVVSGSIGLYILSIISLIISTEVFDNDILAITLFFMIAGIATCILVYHFISTPKYQRNEDTVVEEFKEWKGKKNLQQELRSTISTILWLMIVIIYLAISFATSSWAISWIIFIIGACLDEVIKLLFKIWR